MDTSQPTHGSQQDRPRRRRLTLPNIRSLFERFQHSVRSHLHLPLPTTSHIRDTPQDTITVALPSDSGERRYSLPLASARHSLAIGTFAMSSSRGLRRATGQQHTLDESPLEHAVRRSRRVAGAAPESGPYLPPPRRPTRQGYFNLTQPEPQPHPPPPSSTFTFTQSNPSVPSPGFGPARIPTMSPDPIQPSHLYPPVHPLMANNVDRQAAIAPAHSHIPPADPLVSVKVEEKERACDICCEASEEPLLQPCRFCAATYCGDCIRTMFLNATHDSTSMPPRCCDIVSTITALDFLTTAEADAYRLKFEEWVSTKHTYCPVPKCSRFIPDRAVLQPPSTDPLSVWDLLKQELPAVMAKLQKEHCARYLVNASSPEARGIDNWKAPRKMVWLEDISARLPRYSNMAEFATDFHRLYAGGRSMPPQPSACADVLRKRLWKEIGKIKGRASSKFAKLPVSACFSCPGCHIGICPSCKQVAHFGQPCDTAAQDHELAMLQTYGYKKCPRCGHGVKRMYGCRHMQCRCGAHWCWSCSRSFDQCGGECDAADSDSEDGPYSDEELDPDTPQTNTVAQRAQNGGTNVTATVPIPAIAPALGNVSTTANQTATSPAEAVRLDPSVERPINLDAGSHRDWEASGANFGDEPAESDELHNPIWTCPHVLRPAQLSEEAFKRGVPLGIECFRCFARAYAIVQKPNSEPSPKNQDSGDSNHKHTAEEDMAWRCIDCELLLCGICKNDVKSDQEL